MRNKNVKAYGVLNAERLEAGFTRRFCAEIEVQEMKKHNLKPIIIPCTISYQLPRKGKVKK